MADAGRPTLRVDPQKDKPSAPSRLPMPSSAHCTATPVAAWRRVIASPLVALASKSAARRVCGRRWAWRLLAQQLGGHVSRSAGIAHAPMNQSRSASTLRRRFTPEGPLKVYRPEFRCSGCHRLIHLKVPALLDSP